MPFVSDKRLQQTFRIAANSLSNALKIPLTKSRMLVVWPSIAEGFPTASSRVICNENCQVLVKNLNCLAGMTRRFVCGQETHQILFKFQQIRLASRSKFSSWSQDVSSLALYRRGIPNRKFTSYMHWKLSSTCEEFKLRGWYDAAFRLCQETHQILFEFQQPRWASRSNSRSRSPDVSSLALYRRGIPNRKFTSYMQ